MIVPGPESTVIEAAVAVEADAEPADAGPQATIVSWVERSDVRPALLFEESMRAINALKADPDWQEAMRRRGITDFDKVQVDPWPTGNFGRPEEENRRIARCLSYYREHPTDNGYARPIEGVIATVDAARGQVLEMLDYGIVPMPEETGSYYPEDHEPLTDRPVAA